MGQRGAPRGRGRSGSRPRNRSEHTQRRENTTSRHNNRGRSRSRSHSLTREERAPSNHRNRGRSKQRHHEDAPRERDMNGRDRHRERSMNRRSVERNHRSKSRNRSGREHVEYDHHHKRATETVGNVPLEIITDDNGKVSRTFSTASPSGRSTRSSKSGRTARTRNSTKSTKSTKSSSRMTKEEFIRQEKPPASNSLEAVVFFFGEGVYKVVDGCCCPSGDKGNTLSPKKTSTSSRVSSPKKLSTSPHFHKENVPPEEPSLASSMPSISSGYTTKAYNNLFDQVMRVGEKDSATPEMRHLMKQVEQTRKKVEKRRSMKGGDELPPSGARGATRHTMPPQPPQPPQPPSVDSVSKEDSTQVTESVEDQSRSIDESISKSLDEYQQSSSASSWSSFIRPKIRSRSTHKRGYKPVRSRTNFSLRRSRRE